MTRLVDLRLGAPAVHQGDLYRIMSARAFPHPQLVDLGHPNEVGGSGRSFWPPVHTVPVDQVLTGIGLARQLGATT